MKIVFISDVSLEQIISGVAIWIANIKRELETKGHTVELIHPGLFSFTVPLITDPEIKLSFFGGRKMEALLQEMNPDQIHITTEGPLGLTALKICKRNNWKFTSFYHSRMPEYIEMRFKGMGGLARRYLKWFHDQSRCVMVPTPSFSKILKKEGLKHLEVVPHGIDTQLFKKNPKAKIPKSLKKPIFIFFGRLAPEKNVEQFLALDLPGSKLVIGSGPARKKLERDYKGQALFAGLKREQALVDLLSISDVYVFPSKTDTFGLTIVEALACELPVAAYDVTGPKDILTQGKDGFMGPDLQKNALACLKLNRKNCLKKANQYSWVKSAERFLELSVNKDASSGKIIRKARKIGPKKGAQKS